MGFDHNDEFEIPGAYSGLFACRAEAWLGYNENFRGFGAEDFYLHAKYRHAGRRALSLGFLHWVHEFRQSPPPYPMALATRVRKYVLWHLELGLPLDGIRANFVDSARMTQEQFDAIVADPIQLPAGLTPPPATPATGPPKPVVIPPDRPGSESLLLTKELGIEPKPGCTCGKLAAAMDILGVDGCKAARDVLAGKMKANAKLWTWLEKLTAGSKAVRNGVPINPLDPYGSIIDEACKRAEAKIG